VLPHGRGAADRHCTQLFLSVRRERAKREAQERERREHEGERTFGRLVELWLAAHGQPNKRPSSQETDRSILKCHLLPRFASTPVTALTKADVRTMMAEMQAAKIAIQANRARALLSATMEYGAEELGWRDSNPCRGVKRFTETGRLVSLTRAVFVRLCLAIKEHPNRQAGDALKLMLYTGARRGEVLGARWSACCNGCMTRPTAVRSCFPAIGADSRLKISCGRGTRSVRPRNSTTSAFTICGTSLRPRRWMPACHWTTSRRCSATSPPR
jgi:hypothetical protein